MDPRTKQRARRRPRPRLDSARLWPTPAGREALAAHRQWCRLRFRLTDQGWGALAARAGAAPATAS